jgi:hypothetical protein
MTREVVVKFKHEIEACCGPHRTSCVPPAHEAKPLSIDAADKHLQALGVRFFESINISQILPVTALGISRSIPISRNAIDQMVRAA